VPQQHAFKGWPLVTIVLLMLGYTGYYFCRSNLSVVLPLLIQEMSHRGISPDLAKIRLGSMVSFGVLAYAVGKFVSGSIADLFGGKKNFLGGMGGAIVFTLIFAMSGGLPLFTLAWLGNRLFQSAGWAGLVKVTSRWFSYSSYGTVMGVLCLSYLFGDALCRYIMSLLLAAGVGWRGIFFVGAGALSVLCARLRRSAVFPRRKPIRQMFMRETKGKMVKEKSAFSPFFDRCSRASLSGWYVCSRWAQRFCARRSTSGRQLTLFSSLDSRTRKPRAARRCFLSSEDSP